MDKDPDVQRDLDGLSPAQRERWERVTARSLQLKALGKMRAAAEERRQKRRQYRLHAFGAAGLVVVAAFADLMHGSGWLWLAVPGGTVYLYFVWRALMGSNQLAALRQQQMELDLQKAKQEAKAMRG